MVEGMYVWKYAEKGSNCVFPCYNMDMDDAILSAMANKTRLQLLVCLSSGDKNVTDLIGKCGLSQSAVSQHLEKLRNAGLVATERKGKEIFYHLVDPASATVSQTMLTFISTQKE